METMNSIRSEKEQRSKGHRSRILRQALGEWHCCSLLAASVAFEKKLCVVWGLGAAAYY